MNGHWYTDKNGNHYFVENGQSPKEGWEASKRRKMIDGGEYKVSEDGNEYKSVSRDEYDKFEADDDFDINNEDDFGFDEDGDREYSDDAIMEYLENYDFNGNESFEDVVTLVREYDPNITNEEAKALAAQVWDRVGNDSEDDYPEDEFTKSQKMSKEDFIDDLVNNKGWDKEEAKRHADLQFGESDEDAIWDSYNKGEIDEKTRNELNQKRQEELNKSNSQKKPKFDINEANRRTMRSAEIGQAAQKARENGQSPQQVMDTVSHDLDIEPGSEEYETLKRYAMYDTRMNKDTGAYEYNKYHVGSNKLLEKPEDRAKMAELASEFKKAGLDVKVEDGWEDYGAGMQWTNLTNDDTWVLNPRDWMDYMNGNADAKEIVDRVKNGEYKNAFKWQEKSSEPGGRVEDLVEAELKKDGLTDEDIKKFTNKEWDLFAKLYEKIGRIKTERSEGPHSVHDLQDK